MQQQQPAKESLLTVAQIPSLDGGVVTIILTVLAVLVLGAFAYLLVYRWRRRGSTPVPQGERSWREYGSLYVVLWAIGAVIIGFLSVLSLFLLGRFEDVDQALGFLTAFFGAIVGLVGTYFGIKTSSDAAAGAQNAAAGAQKLLAGAGGDVTQPLVASFTPADNAKDVSTKVTPTATFSKDMDEVTINETTFKLVVLGGNQDDVEPVSPRSPGGVRYDEATKVATFTPASDLQYGKKYGVTITSGVRDKAGNSLAQDKIWHFTTQEDPTVE
jgi:heme/copper-type cytochrome/quinol oxidase subunit 2